MSRPDGAPEGPHLDVSRPPPNPAVWLLRIAIGVMLAFGGVTLWKRWSPDPVQDELVRYATLTLPAYLEELARLHALLERLDAPGLEAGPARALLVDQVMPQLVRMRRHAAAVTTRSAPAREANAEYLAALDLYLAMDRAAVRAIDEPATSPIEAQRAIVEQRRAADESVRRFVAHLAERSKRAGIRVVPAAVAP